MGMKFPSEMIVCPFNDCTVMCTGRPHESTRVPDRVPQPAPPPIKVYVKVKKKPKEVVKKCAWHRCLNAARPRRKYCSKACSNRNARKCYRERKKLERKEEE